jgi:hypothetical protein
MFTASPSDKPISSMAKRPCSAERLEHHCGELTWGGQRAIYKTALRVYTD